MAIGCGSETGEGPPAHAADAPAHAAEAPSDAPSVVPESGTTIDPSALPAFASGDDITVEAVQRVSPRTVDVFVSTPNIAPNVRMTGRNAMRITLPEGYATSGKRYPVILFLHGGTCNYTSNYIAFDVEAKTKNSEVIVVTPEGGEFGFYTDWVDQSIPQKWETYHLDQVVPFIDRNLRTIATKEGRAVMGVSMGGLGAMRYAVDRPELFAAAATLSGIVDLENAAVQLGIVAVLANARINVAGPFGIIGLSPTWHAVNPASPARVTRLATVKTFVYVGQGTDPTEQTTTNSGNVLRNVLSAAQIPFFFLNYGSPGDTPWGRCNGGHEDGCFNYAFVDAFPRVMAELARPL